MSTPTVIGIDAGGTGTRTVLVRGGRVLRRGSAGPMNLLLHADAVQRLAELILVSSATVAGVGLAGLRDAQAAARVEAELAVCTGTRVVVRDDAEAALAGAFLGGPGVVVIAGTGSAALGRDESGRGVRVGGHGFLLGDEGGGWWLGREAVAAALRSADGTGPTTELVELVTAAFGGLERAVSAVHAAPADRTLLSRLVPGLARSGDPVAREILARGAEHLTRLAAAVQARLGPLPLAMVGGVFRVPAVRQGFTDLTGAAEPLASAEEGAALLTDPAAPAMIGFRA